MAYSYVVTDETDPSAPVTEDAPTYEHLDVASITDENGKTYSFGYELNQFVQYYQVNDGVTSERVMVGLPSLVSAVQLPSGLVTTFGGTRAEKFGQDESFMGAVTTIVNGGGGRYIYDFTSPQVFWPVGSDPGSTDTVSRHATVTYCNTVITSPPPNDGQSTGTETFAFDYNNGMGLKKVVDLSGNVTTFDFEGGFDDPVQQTNAKGYVKKFTYDATFHVMTSMTDENNVTTTYEIDPATGVHKKETVTERAEEIP